MKTIERETYRGGTEVIIAHEEALYEEARFACELMRTLAICAGVPDGETTTGHQRLRLMTPDECVERATTIASAAWAEFRKRGWVLGLPLPKPPEQK